jgi:hypothetical protein
MVDMNHDVDGLPARALANASDAGLEVIGYIGPIGSLVLFRIEPSVGPKKAVIDFLPICTMSGMASASRKAVRVSRQYS